MYGLALIVIAILQTCKGCLPVAEKGEIVDTTVKLTSNMTLKCVYPKTENISQMSWSKKNKSKQTIAVFRPPHDFYIIETYKDRVNIVDQPMNDKSLIFNSTTETDSGLYVCSFQSFPHGRWEKKVRVVQTAGNFTPPVSEASHVNVEPGRNVTLSCGTDRAITMTHVTWERVQEGTVDTIVQCTQLSLSFHGSDYEERVETDCATQATTIVLWNVTEADSGMFRCCYTGPSGESGAHWMKLTVTLNVPLDYKHQIFAIAGGAAAGAAVFLLILILPIVAIVHCRKKKRKRIEMPPKVLLTTQSSAFKSSGSAFHRPWNAGERAMTTVSDTKEDAVYVNYPQLQKLQL